MNFGSILEEWEKQKRPGKEKKQRYDFGKIIDKYPPLQRKDEKGYEDAKKQAVKRREFLRKLKPQDILDLHGLKTADALAALYAFITKSRNRGFKKVLIIHGKGIHSTNGPVLHRVVIDFLEKNKSTGEFGSAEREYGGKGALWVILR